MSLEAGEGGGRCEKAGKASPGETGASSRFNSALEGRRRAASRSCLRLLGAPTPTQLHSRARAKVLEALGIENATVPREGTSSPTTQDTECSYADIQTAFSCILVAKSGLL